MERTVFHNDSIQQITFADERYYTKDWKSFKPSSTYVLDKALVKGEGFEYWLKQQGENADIVKNDAGLRGTKVHGACEQIARGIPVYWQNPFTGECDYTIFEWQMICRFFDFITRFKPEILAIEKKLISENLRLGGCMDLGVYLEGLGVGVLDIKTSKAVHLSHELQISTYAEMWNEVLEEEGKPLVDFTAVLHLNAQTKTEGKKGAIQGEGWKLHIFERHYKKSFELFCNVRAIFDELVPIQMPKNLVYPDRLCTDTTEFDKIKQSLNIE